MKTNQSPLKKILGIAPLVLVFLVFACSKDVTDPEIPDDDNPSSGTNLTFDSVISKGDEFTKVPQSKTEELLEEGEEYSEDYVTNTGSDTETFRYICKSRTVSVTDGTGEFQTLGGVASEIYPGALLQGETINNVKPQGIPLKRAGGSISYTLNDGNLQASQDLDEMSESQVRQAMNNIISGSSGVVPSNFVLNYENVFSEEQLALEMGLSYEGYGVKAEGKLAFSSENTYNRVLVKLNQSYYDVSYDFPTSYDDVFDESVTPEDLNKYVQADNPATYIKKVTYGRIFYMLIESTSSLDEMNTQISASYESFNNKIDGDLKVDTMNKMENLKVKVIAYGGDSQNTFATLGETNVQVLANMLAASTDIRTALPLSYEIYSLEDPSEQVGVNISTEMEIVECELKGVLPPTGYTNLVGLFEDGIGAATSVAGGNAILFNGAGTEYVWYNGNTTNISPKYSINNANAPLGDIGLVAVDAATLYIPSEIWLYEKGSLKFRILKFDNESYFGNTIPNKFIGERYFGPGNVNQTHNNDVKGGNSFPMDNSGFDAVAYLGVDVEVVETNTTFTRTVTRVTTFKHEYFEKGKNNFRAVESYVGEYSLTTNLLTGGINENNEIYRTWSSKTNISENDNFPIKDIGATCRISLGNSELGIEILYFDSEGKTMFIRNATDGSVEGPYVIN
jgi:thiol-activated cytolysin